MKYLFDTHTWIWWHTDSGKLSPKVKKLITAVDGYTEILLSSISPWEFCKLLEKRKIAVSCNPENWLEHALRMEKLRLVALTPRIAYRATTLPKPFHRDPGDQIIVATAREERAVILTKDQSILDYKHVKSTWW